MIFVSRAVPPPAILTDASRKGGGPQEKARAIAFYKKKGNRKKAFPFKAYRHESVKAALEKLFQGKCAYCESEYMHVMPGEVEHWRPKGELEDDAGKKIKPGYYWLAADWDNLLPSCIDCNRSRYQKVCLSGGEKVLLGKQNSFPLATGSRRAKKPGEEANEIPLLLHPCKDRPEDFLEFAENDESRGIISWKLDAARQPLPKSKTSIDTYGLLRQELVGARRKRFIEIEEQKVRVQEAVRRVDNERLNAAERQQEDVILWRELSKLKSFKEANQSFSLMAKQIVDKFVAQVAQLRDRK